MTLREFCIKADCEVEVWDKEVDLGAPYYNYYGENTYYDTDEEPFLFLMENWLLSLPVAEVFEENRVSVDVYSQVEGKIKKGDPADCVEDVFICLAVGDHSYARRFCRAMGIESVKMVS